MKNNIQLNWFSALLLVFFFTALIGISAEALYQALGINWPNLIKRLAIGLFTISLFLFLAFLYQQASDWIEQYRYRRSPFFTIDQSQAQLQQAMAEIAREKSVLKHQNQKMMSNYLAQKTPSKHIQSIINEQNTLFKIRFEELEDLNKQLKTQHAELSQYREELHLLKIVNNTPDFEHLEALKYRTADLISSTAITLKVDLDFEIIERTSRLSYITFD